MTLHSASDKITMEFCLFLQKKYIKGSQNYMIKLNISKKDVVLLIPALNPNGMLIKLIEDLAPVWNRPIVVVDDGSSEKARKEIFPVAEAMGCNIITHNVNLGKGRALKNGFNYILNAYPEALGAVTADSDYQHLPEDIIACAEALVSSEEPLPLVLGCRDFDDPKVPQRSKLGNKITRNFMRVMNGVDVTDTQTGLRAISSEFMKYLMNVPGERFEFEVNMLTVAKQISVPFKEITIQTVYIDNNSATTFNPVKDSIKIYLNPFKACRKKLLAIAAVIAGIIIAAKAAVKISKRVR